MRSSRAHRPCSAFRVVAPLICLLWLRSPAHAQFETRAYESFPEGAYSIATGDFNHDGKLDVVVMTGFGFSVALGNGDGTFQKPVTYGTEVALALAVADFNGDGNLDIVVANVSPATVNVYLGNGDGTFQTKPLTSRTTESNSFVAVGDFNGDGKPDIVVIDSPYISVLLGNGDGTFKPPTDNDSFIDPGSLAVADFNNDSKLDVVAAGSFGSTYSIGVLLGRGNGTLENAITQSAEYVPGAVAAGDLSGDGNMDAVLAYDLGGIGVFLGNGDGTLQPPVIYDTTGLSGGQVLVYDLNLDGKLDVALPSQAGFGGSGIGGVDVFWGKGDGTLGPAQFFASGITGIAAVGDLNGDHLPDFVMGSTFRGVATMLNTGVADFSPTSRITFPTQPMNTKSAAQAVTLTNGGASPLSISSIKASGEFKQSNTCGSSIPAGGQCTISAIFQPPTIGTYAGLITLFDGASTRPQFIDLTGTATAVAVSPDSLNFGAQKVGTTSPPQVVTATNVGSSAITFSSVGVTAGSKDFSSTSDCTAGSIQPGASCTASVTFDPQKTGLRTANLYFNLPKGSVDPLPVALSGTGR